MPEERERESESESCLAIEHTQQWNKEDTHKKQAQWMRDDNDDDESNKEDIIHEV